MSPAVAWWRSTRDVPPSQAAGAVAHGCRRRAMTALHRLCIAGGLCCLSLAAPAATEEDASLAPLWLVEIGQADERYGAAPRVSFAPLNLPAGWSAGDAAAIVVADPADADPASRTLIPALLGAGAAVLELRVLPMLASAGAPPGAAAFTLLPDVLAGILTLRRDAGAGLVVVVGYGPAGGPAALAAAALAAERHSDRMLSGLAAAAALGPGSARFAAGPLPAARENWPERAQMLCALLHAAVTPPGADFHPDCIEAFVLRAAMGAERRPASGLSRD